MSLISAGSISLDSAFKYLKEGEINAEPTVRAQYWRVRMNDEVCSYISYLKFDNRTQEWYNFKIRIYNFKSAGIMYQLITALLRN